SLSEQDFESLRQDGLPSSVLTSGELEKPLTTLLVDQGLAASGKQVKEALARGAVTINGAAHTMDDNIHTARCFEAGRASYGRFFLVRMGKKNYHLFELG